MKINELHIGDKPVSAISLFKGGQGNATAIRIMADEILKEHITTVPALLLCIAGNAVYENENDLKETLRPGDYISIEPMIKHWVKGLTESHLILFK